ncbi:atpase aaa [Phytophthora cinnamomi]|uniref:atpase aaa n=1 Tax=Phytophthora cinnamomi TaxID=4785 RepID=UPI0035596BA1|nr:atpase aaa [Phytophthora cinnamomi]
MRVEVEVAPSADISSAAYVSPTTFRSLNAAWGCYVSLRRCGMHRMRVFRLEIDEKLEEYGAVKVRIDHWPEGDTEGSCNAVKTGGGVEVECISPSEVRVVQYLALAPAGDSQPKLALPFVRSLLRGRILSGRAGSIALQSDGLDYGRWTYEAFFRGRRAEDGALEFDGGVVTDQTLVLMFPSASTASSRGEPKYQPVGAHARGFKELVAMALRGVEMPGGDDAHGGAKTIAAPHSLLLHAPSGAGKTTLVHQIAKELLANLLVIDGGLLASPQLRLEDFFSVALRIQPCVLLLEDLELLFPMTLDETKYTLVCRLVSCLESIQKSESVRVAVIGTVSVLGTLHSKVRQLFTEEVFLDVPDKQWTLDLLTSLLPSSNTLRPEFLMSLAVRYGQRPSNIAAIAQQIGAVSDDSEMHSNTTEPPAMGSISTGQIFVLAATNALSAIDPAFLQPGRFENVVYVGLPNASERKSILEIQRSKMPWSQDVDFAKLVEETDGANAASLIALCQSAAIQAMQRIPPNAPVDEQCIAMADFVAALAKGNFDFQKSA